MLFNLAVHCSKILLRSSYVVKVHGLSSGKRLGFPWEGCKNSIVLGCTHYSSSAKLRLNTPRAIEYLKKVRLECDSTKSNRPNAQILLDLFEKRDGVLENISNLEDMNTEQDKELKSLIQEEKEIYTHTLEQLEDAILKELVHDKHASYKNVQLEITGGEGGQESMIFAGELFNMYNKYAQFKGWDFQVEDLKQTELGGLRKCTVFVSGEMAYRYLSYESGVHRVQRVPSTERGGRIHTSTAAVVVLPQPTEVDIVIDSKDLAIEAMRASGPGGQHVNKTESAIRITHLPSGIVVESSNNRSQLRNRATAMVKLRTRLYDIELEKQESQSSTMRRQQLGNRERSFKVRTYNFQQDRITDHRVGGNIHGVASFMEGGEELNKLITRLDEFNTQKTLENFVYSLQ